MKEFIEKLIGRLEEEKAMHTKFYRLSEYRELPEIKTRHELIMHNLNKTIQIVNQLAEEYNQEHDDTDYANIELYAFWQKHQWILCSERLPEEKENPITSNYYVYPVMVQFEHITDIRYYSFGNGHWWHGPSIMDKYVTHWMDIAPYQPKGE